MIAAPEERGPLAIMRIGGIDYLVRLKPAPGYDDGRFLGIIGTATLATIGAITGIVGALTAVGGLSLGVAGAIRRARQEKDEQPEVAELVTDIKMRAAQNELIKKSTETKKAIAWGVPLAVGAAYMALT